MTATRAVLARRPRAFRLRHMSVFFGTVPAAFACTIIILVLCAAIMPQVLAPHSPTEQDILHRLHGPSAAHPLGLDYIGRDTLSRLVYATREAMEVALPAVGLAVVLGSILGLFGGYVGGAVDNAVVILLDSIQAVPAIVLALALLAAIGPHLWSLIFVIGLAFTPGYARVTRGLVINTKRLEFVEAERIIGVSALRVVVLHILPVVFAPVLIVIAIDIPAAVTVEAGLSFLGLGTPPPTPTFGAMLYDGFLYLQTSPWEVVFTGLTLILITLAFTLLGERLRDIADPRSAVSVARLRRG